MSPKTGTAIELIDSIIALFLSKVGFNQDTFTRRNWESFLAVRMNALGIKDYASYYQLLASSEGEFANLAELVVVPETWFFREPAALELAADLIEKRGAAKPARVLSAACSSGEEPYSLAMLLRSRFINPASFFIDAIDLSKALIDEAKRGVYTPYAFRRKNASYRERFFEKVDGNFAIKEDLKESVHFHVGNILGPHFMRDRGRYEIVFCRNLFIYLTRHFQEIAMDRLDALIEPGGVLFVGATECECVRRRGWVAVEPMRACGFRRPQDRSSQAYFADEDDASSAKRQTAQSLEVATPTLEEASDLANRGFYQEALELCRGYVKNHGGKDPEAYFLMGVIEHACALTDLAEASFMKAIYLQPNHVKALTYLILLTQQRGDEAKSDVYKQRLNRLGRLNE